MLLYIGAFLKLFKSYSSDEQRPEFSILEQIKDNNAQYQPHIINLLLATSLRST